MCFHLALAAVLRIVTLRSFRPCLLLFKMDLGPGRYEPPNPSFKSDPTGTAKFEISQLGFPVFAHHSVAGRAG